MPGFLAWATEWIKVAFTEMGEHWRSRRVWGNDKSSFQQVELESWLKTFITQLVTWV